MAHHRSYANPSHLPGTVVDGESNLLESTVLVRAIQEMNRAGPNQRSSLAIHPTPSSDLSSSPPNSSSTPPTLSTQGSSSFNPTSSKPRFNPACVKSVWSSSTSPSPNSSAQIGCQATLDAFNSLSQDRIAPQILGGAIIPSTGSASTPDHSSHPHPALQIIQPAPIVGQHQHHLSLVIDPSSSAQSASLNSSADHGSCSSASDPNLSGSNPHFNSILSSSSSSSSSSTSSTNQASPPSSLISSSKTSTPPSVASTSVWQLSGNPELLNYSSLLNGAPVPTQDPNTIPQRNRSLSSSINPIQYSQAPQNPTSYVNLSNHGSEGLSNTQPYFNSDLSNNSHQPLLGYISSPRSTPTLGRYPPILHQSGNFSNSLPSPADLNLSMLHHRPYNQHLSHVTGWHGGLDGYSSAFYDPFQIKHRRRTTPAQLGVLEAQFESNCKPDVVLRKQLAEQLDMTPREVQVWFQNRRAKTKKLEKRAEQESGKPGGETEGNPFISNQVTLSPPTSVFTGPSSGHACGLTVVRNESPEEDSLASNREQVDEGDSENSVLTHHRLEAERRIRSHSLHHHPYFLPPWSNQHPNQSNALSSLVTNSMFSSSGPSDEESKSSDRRGSHASIASSMTTTNSSIAITPTTTDFVHDDAITMVTGSGYPDGYDPRRRSSCPAEFIQSFDHFGLSQHAISSLHPLATNFESGSASQTSCDSKTQSEWMNGGSQATALDPCNSSYLSNWTGGVEDWKLDASREGGLPRRHSMASIRASEPVRISQLGQQSVNEEHSFMVFSENKAPNRIEKPIKIMGGCSNGVGPGGYARRSSTSVLLNSIEEHPVSSWNP